MKDFKTNIKVLLGIGIMFSLLSGGLFARDLDKVMKDQKSAPDIEDHNNFFNTTKNEATTPEQEKVADDLRLKTIDSINSLLKDRKTETDKKFELYLRLAEIYVERHDYIRALEISEFTKSYDQWVKSGQKDPEPKISHEKSQGELTNATNTLRLLANTYPKHPRIDSVLFELGRNLTRLGNSNAALYFETLLKEHPHSTLIPETNLALGEMYFDKHDIPKAMSYYKETMKFKEHRVYPYAVYKLGWSYFNANFANQKEQNENYTKTIAAFKLVIKLADLGKEKMSTLVNLREEAVKDLVVVWAETEDIESAWAYFREIGENNYFYTMLERLGQTYYDNGKNNKAIAVFNRVLKEAPLRKASPVTYNKLVALYDVVNDYDNVIRGLNNMVDLYTGQSPWIKENSAETKLIDLTQTMLEKSIYRFAATYHNQSIKKIRPAGNENAKTLYKLYLKNFPAGASAYEARYNLAETYMHSKQWDDAATEYLTVSQKSDGKYLKDAAHNSVVAMNKVIQNTTFAKLPPPGEVAEALKVPAEKDKLVKVLDNYVTQLPTETNAPELSLIAAGVYFSYGHYDEALKRYNALITKFPASKEADSAVRMSINYFAKRQQHDKVISFSEKYLKDKSLNLAKDTVSFLTTSAKFASFNIALNLEKQKNYVAAAESFATYANKYPDDENADVSLHNSALNYVRANKITDAAKALVHLTERYPKSGLKVEALAKLGEINEGLGELAAATTYFGAITKEFPNDKRASQACFNAGIISAAQGKTESAIEYFQIIASKYASSEVYRDGVMKLAEQYEKHGDFKQAMNTYELAAKASKSEPAIALLAEAKAAKMAQVSGDHKLATKKFNQAKTKLIASAKVPAFEARRIVAEYYFENNTPIFNEFMALKLGSDKIEEQIIKKQNVLKTMAANFESIIMIGSADYLVASLYQLGLAHEDFSTKLFAVNPPAGSKPKEIDEFKSALEKLAFPLKEEAQKYFEASYDKSLELEALNNWSQLAYKKLATINPAKYSDSETLNVPVGYSGHTMSWNDGVKGLTD